MNKDYIYRTLNLKKITDQKTCFLLGPRQTGKSSLIEHELSNTVIIDLLDEEIFLRLQKNSKDLMSYVTDSKKLVVLDEIQRIPQLLNEVHRLIEKEGMRFLLTGSSARKLRRGGVNLLGGRARSRILHPLTSLELKSQFNLQKAINRGTLPHIYFSDDPWDDLKSYVSEYLKEEIMVEAATRNLSAFARFLETSALHNGGMINYEKIGNAAQATRATTQNYYQILRDTLIGRDLPIFKKTKKHKPKKTNKFYFFDLGVVNYLKNIRDIRENSADYGSALEAHLHHELSSFCDYYVGNSLSYWRSQEDIEVDFLLNDSVAIEVKATRFVKNEDLKGLLTLAENIKLKHSILVCRETTPRVVQKIQILPIEIFLERLWAGDFGKI